MKIRSAIASGKMSQLQKHPLNLGQIVKDLCILSIFPQTVDTADKLWKHGQFVEATHKQSNFGQIVEAI